MKHNFNQKCLDISSLEQNVSNIIYERVPYWMMLRAVTNLIVGAVIRQFLYRYFFFDRYIFQTRLDDIVTTGIRSRVHFQYFVSPRRSLDMRAN